MRQASTEQGEALALARRLKERRGEIEEATLLRVRALADPPQVSEAEYAQGLQRAVAVALDYGIEGIAKSEEQVPAPPPELLAQARLAARNRVGLDVVLRRYVAGQTLLGDFLIAEAAELSPAEPKRSLRRLSALLERLLATVSTAYEEELKLRRRGSERHRAERVERLLAGEPLETAGLSYGFEAHHLAVLAQGQGAQELLEALASELDARLLSVERERSLLWAWLGSRRQPDQAKAMRLAKQMAGEGTFVSLGEPGEGIAGWRLTHRQAQAALAVAQRGEEPVVRYAEVALLASAMQNELLVASLQGLFLEPLEAERDGGEVARETLRTHLATGGNISSSAAALGVDRRTVTRRIRMIEERLGHSLSGRAAEVEVALGLWELEESSAGRGGTRWDTDPRDHPQSDQAAPPPG
jgi:hypothetical protein